MLKYGKGSHRISLRLLFPFEFILSGLLTFYLRGKSLRLRLTGLFFLHLGGYAVALFFNFYAVFIAHDIIDIGFNSTGCFTLGVHVFIAPNRIFAVVGIFQSRCYTVDADRHNVFVVDEVGQSYIADSALGLGNGLDQCAAIIGFQRFVGSFFSAGQSQFSEEGTGAGSGRTGYEDDWFIRAANVFPVGYFCSEYILQLLFGQALYLVADIFIGNRSNGQNAYFVVYESFSLVSRKLLFSRNVGVADVYGAFSYLFQAGAGTACIQGNGNIWVLCLEFCCCIFSKREQSGRTGNGYLAGNFGTGSCRTFSRSGISAAAACCCYQCCTGKSYCHPLFKIHVNPP